MRERFGRRLAGLTDRATVRARGRCASLSAGARGATSLIRVQVVVCDVGPRDGLQNEPEVLEPSLRAELVSRLARAGVPRIEAVSFVRPDLVPQMTGAEEVVAAVEPRAGTELSGLVLNEQGYERLRATPLDRVNCTLAATESFSRRNANAGVDEALAALEAVSARADRPVTVTVSVAFGCPFEGEVDPGRVVALCERLTGAGELVLADTIGVATPGRVRALFERVGALGPPVGFHGHDTRHTGVASAWAALEAGASVLDASVGGLGGCPFAPRATGNVATEDVVYLLEREGVETGVDLDALIGVAEWLAGLLGRDLPGRVYRAGGFPRATTPASASAATSSSE
jgi:isopropylmalate/homocitrate/citramalate synthase